MAVESVGVWLARLEGSYVQINERLSSIESRLGALEQMVVQPVSISIEGLQDQSGLGSTL